MVFGGDGGGSRVVGRGVAIRFAFSNWNSPELKQKP